MRRPNLSPKLKSPNQLEEFFSFLEVGKASVTNRRHLAETLATICNFSLSATYSDIGSVLTNRRSQKIAAASTLLLCTAREIDTRQQTPTSVCCYLLQIVKNNLGIG